MIVQINFPWLTWSLGSFFSRLLRGDTISTVAEVVEGHDEA